MEIYIRKVVYSAFAMVLTDISLIHQVLTLSMMPIVALRVFMASFSVSILLNSSSFTVAKRRLCSPDTSAIIDLIVYRK